MTCIGRAIRLGGEGYLWQDDARVNPRPVSHGPARAFLLEGVERLSCRPSGQGQDRAVGRVPVRAQVVAGAGPPSGRHAALASLSRRAYPSRPIRDIAHREGAAPMHRPSPLA